MIYNYVTIPAGVDHADGTHTVGNTDYNVIPLPLGLGETLTVTGKTASSFTLTINNVDAVNPRVYTCIIELGTEYNVPDDPTPNAPRSTFIMKGSAIIPAGTVYVDVPHGLVSAPNSSDISVTPQSVLGARNWKVPANQINNLTFRIEIDSIDITPKIFSYFVFYEGYLKPTASYYNILSMQKGSASIPANTTYIDVAHGLVTAPNVNDISITPQSLLHGQWYRVPNDQITNYSFRIEICGVPLETIIGGDTDPKVFSWMIFNTTEIETVAASYRTVDNITKGTATILAGSTFVDVEHRLGEYHYNALPDADDISVTPQSLLGGRGFRVPENKINTSTFRIELDGTDLENKVFSWMVFSTSIVVTQINFCVATDVRKLINTDLTDFQINEIIVDADADLTNQLNTATMTSSNQKFCSMRLAAITIAQQQRSIFKGDGQLQQIADSIKEWQAFVDKRVGEAGFGPIPVRSEDSRWITVDATANYY